MRPIPISPSSTCARKHDFQIGDVFTMTIHDPSILAWLRAGLLGLPAPNVVQRYIVVGKATEAAMTMADEDRP